ncbi:unnamed protein product [Litomosoides sigmodontis]|uniref:Uncharacterized protein n=1 Tax=Litomosoides sigmodontis TaxID=42156 RepID=A0A3P6SBW9_LITSI|nr:unnamed protein product [Litomosoides sigmodontis]
MPSSLEISLLIPLESGGTHYVTQRNASKVLPVPCATTNLRCRIHASFPEYVETSIVEINKKTHATSTATHS